MGPLVAGFGVEFIEPGHQQRIHRWGCRSQLSNTQANAGAHAEIKRKAQLCNGLRELTFYADNYLCSIVAIRSIAAKREVRNLAGHGVNVVEDGGLVVMTAPLVVGL